jgi:hypothetical protein
VRRKGVWFIAILIVFASAYNVRGGEAGPAAKQKEVHVNADIPRISANEAKKLFDQGKLLLVNTQDADGIKKSMLIGAIAAPGGLIGDSLINVPDDMIVAFYCM